MGSDQEQFARSGLWPFAPATRDSGMEIRLLTAIRAARAKASPRSTNVGVAVWSNLCRRPVAGGASPRKEVGLGSRANPSRSNAAPVHGRRGVRRRRWPAIQSCQNLVINSLDRRLRGTAAVLDRFRGYSTERRVLAVNSLYFTADPFGRSISGCLAEERRPAEPVRCALGNGGDRRAGAGAALFRRPKAGAGASSIGGGIGRGDR
jgi:hypothetical protein